MAWHYVTPSQATRSLPAGCKGDLWNCHLFTLLLVKVIGEHILYSQVSDLFDLYPHLQSQRPQLPLDPRTKRQKFLSP